VPTLLGRDLTPAEQKLQEALAQRPAEILAPNAAFAEMAIRPEFYPAILSLIEVPVPPGWPRNLCGRLTERPDFLAYLADPAQFGEPDLTRICRVLAEIDDTVDLKLAKAMRSLHDRNQGSDAESVVRLLGVLDHISPGRRLVMSLIHLLRATQPAAASKAALLLGKRMQNPEWVDRQMTSSDPRVRANSVESIWGGGNSDARKCLTDALRDGHNRVAGNALVGLHLLGDPSVPTLVRSMLQHENPGFRATAAWVMGKIGAQEFRHDLKRALLDPNAHVRNSAGLALKLLPPEPIAPGSPAENAPEAPAAPADAPSSGVSAKPPDPSPKLPEPAEP
jgi:hypothetical protein